MAAETAVSSDNGAVPAHHFPSLIERYYTQRFALDVTGPSEDYYVYTHTNGIMVIGLAPSHPLVSKKMPIKAVKFQSEHRDFTKNVVRGAKKRGGARLRAEGVLATITCEDGTEFTVKSCIEASLLEVNTQLVTNPNLLVDWPSMQGYLAVCQPLPNFKTPTEQLMSLEEYQKTRFPDSTEVKESSS